MHNERTTLTFRLNPAIRLGPTFCLGPTCSVDSTVRVYLGEAKAFHNNLFLFTANIYSVSLLQ